MPAHKTRAKLAVIVNDHQTGNDQLIEGRANRYQDGPGENYIVLRQLWVDYIQWKAGTITTTELRSRTEVKFGQSGERETAPHPVSQVRRQIPAGVAEVSTEALVHDELTANGARARRIKCSCLHRHREWYCWTAVGGFSGIEDAFLRWMNRRGHMTTNVTYY
ncbi:hypothetical protein C8F04DRAFT_1260864 [Mycena alexandri]|uniref:Uncharacterized protein n=1 Tax=Mycena alexandri TaxID=1745969 RepID=A0AAD6SVS9_9AGAR|nr:hypothetical protein C8F04DRAFT_1260864 [Mycena alexandri]